MDRNNESIKKAVNFLKNSLNKDDFFVSGHLFPNFLILDCISEIRLAELEPLRHGLVEKILKEESENGTFNYWSKNSLKFNSEPYPDDLDDTCCGWAALIKCQPKLNNGKKLAKIIKALILCEYHEGGPYKTWITSQKDSKEWQDVDLAVNCNVAYFLRLLGVKLKSLNDYLQEAILKNKYESKFYKGKIPILFFISRSYHGEHKNKLIKDIVDCYKDDITVLEKSLLILSLLNLGANKMVNQGWIEELLRLQGEDGGWEACDFYYYDFKNGSKFLGSRALTTAFIAEALNKYNLANKDVKGNKDPEKIYLDKVNTSFEQLFNSKKDLRQDIDAVYERIVKIKDNAILWPYFLVNNLKPGLKKQITESFLVDLGVIQILGWVAYSLYDDFIDKDLTDKFLPVSECIKRIFWEKIEELQLGSDFNKFCQKTIYEMEYSYWWELKYYRKESSCFGQKTKPVDFINFLQNRLSGNTITSVAILSCIGYKTDSKETIHLRRFLNNYFVCRQINDDIGDWYKDLKNGQLNFANRTYFNSEINISLKKRFIRETLPSLFQEIKNLYVKSIYEVKSTKLFVNQDIFIKIIDSNLEEINHTRNITKKAVEFIRNYYK